MDELKAAITPKTKMIWINVSDSFPPTSEFRFTNFNFFPINQTPHNPIGKVFDEDELRNIGKIAEEHDLMILSDEVYDCLTFGDKKHIRIAALDDFWRRTVTIGSAVRSSFLPLLMFSLILTEISTFSISLLHFLASLLILTAF